jgi:hypothetical protein
LVLVHVDVFSLLFMPQVAPYLLGVLPKLKHAPVWGDFAPDEVLSFLRSFCSNASIPPNPVESLREVASFLNSADRGHGLTRVPLDTGEVAWMCEEHRIAYRPSIVRDLRFSF